MTPENISFDYRFPALGDYAVTMMGDLPQPFSLVYPVTVMSESGSPDDDEGAMGPMPMSAGEHSVHIAVFGLGILALLYVILKPENKIE